MTFNSVSTNDNLDQRSIAKSTLFNMCWQFVRVFMLGFWVVLLASILGAADYGVYAGIAGIAVTLGGLSGLGTGWILYQNTIRDPKCYSELFSLAIFTTFFSGIFFLIFFVLIGLLVFNSCSFNLLLIIGISELIFFPMTTILGFAFSAKGRVVLSAAVPALFATGRLAFLGVFYLTSAKHTIEQYVYFHLIGAIVIFSVIFLFCLMVTKPKRSRIVFSIRDLRQGVPFCISWSSMNGLSSLDKTLTLLFATSEIAGIYNIAYRMASILTQPIEALTNALMPRLFEKINSPFKSLNIYVVLIVTYGVFANLLLWIITPQLTTILGNDFDDLLKLRYLIGVFIVPSGLRIFFSQILLTSNRVAYKTLIECTGLFLFLLLGPWLIPKYGAAGAFSMVLFTELILVILLLVTILCTEKKP